MKNLDKLFKLADRLEFKLKKQAQTFQYSSDPMYVALNQAFGKILSNLAGQYLQDKPISAIEFRLNFAPPNAKFIVDSTGTAKAEVDDELTQALSKYNSQAAKIMS